MLVVMSNILRHAPITRRISVAVSVIGLLVAFVLLPVHAAEQYRGQVRIPGHMGVLRRPLDERQKYVKFGYMESYDRDGIENADYRPLVSASTRPIVSAEKLPVTNVNIDDLFEPIATTRPCPDFTWVHNPITPLVEGQDAPIGTNKFWQNMASMSQKLNTFLQPYTIRWNTGNTKARLWGMTVNQPGQYPERFAMGNHPEGDPYEHITKHYVVPAMEEAFHFGAVEFDPERTTFHLSETDNMAAVATLSVDYGDGTSGSARFPLVQGAGFVTALYDNLTPILQSDHPLYSWSKIELDKDELSDFENPTVKYKLDFGVRGIWWVYLTATLEDSWSEPSYEFPYFELYEPEEGEENEANRSKLICTAPFRGIIQIAHVYEKPPYKFKLNHDRAAGRFCTGVDVRARIENSEGFYSFVFKTDGLAHRDLMMYALPHHMDTLWSGNRRGHHMRSSTKGPMTALFGDLWVMQEHELPLQVDMFPWTEAEGRPNFSDAVMEKIAEALDLENQEQFDGDLQEAGADDPSIYWTGKFMAKRAHQCLTAYGVFGADSDYAKECYSQLRLAFGRLTSNRRKYPLAYDQTWGGIISTFGFHTINDDYGNLAYNDHHFHYGYIVMVGAVLARLDSSWLTSKNIDYINSLVRDYANPSSADPFFPVFRNFDWFSGHSWAHGIQEQPDGRDQESFSEDVFATFAMKLWGQFSNQPKMYARGAIMLAIERRIIDQYIVMRDDDEDAWRDIHPASFRENKIAVIAFDGKMDATTYFGHSRECMHGIHIVPVSAATRWVRKPEFAKQEWEAFFDSKERWDTLMDDWKGMLVMSKALYDPRWTWDWFMEKWTDDQKEVRKYLERGTSLAWYLMLIASWGGDPENGIHGYWNGTGYQEHRPITGN